MVILFLGFRWDAPQKNFVEDVVWKVGNRTEDEGDIANSGIDSHLSLFHSVQDTFIGVNKILERNGRLFEGAFKGYETCLSGVTGGM